MSPMRRFLSFRDFDWGLLGLVLLLCTVSVLEIYSPCPGEIAWPVWKSGAWAVPSPQLMV